MIRSYNIISDQFCQNIYTHMTIVSYHISYLIKSILWFGTCFICPYIGKNHCQRRTHIFQRGRYTTKQLDYFIIVHSFFAFFRHIFLPNSWGPSFAVQYPQVSKNLSEEGNEVMRPVPVRSIKKVVRTSTRVVHTGAGKRERWGYEILMLQVYMT
jgi:hypothetical protein